MSKSEPNAASRPASPARSTYERALDLLEVRPRGVAELRRLLLRKGEPATDVDAALERLQQAGLLDDAAFARQFARTKAVGAGLSRRRLRQELVKRGVAAELSEQAIAHVFDDEGIDEASTLERLVRKKLGTLSSLDAAVRRRRVYAFLARRGYDHDDIVAALRSLPDGGDAPP